MRINIGCGQDILSGNGWLNVDKNPQHPEVVYLDIDEAGLSMYPDSSFEEIRCRGCLNEFKSDVVTVMNEFWRTLRNGGILDIGVAVVDNSKGPFRDPLARRYLHSEWVQYFIQGSGGREVGGRGLGFKGSFRLVDEVINNTGETHHVILEAIK